LLRAMATRGLAENTRAYYAQSSRFWAPLRGTRLPGLRRAQVEDAVVLRSQTNPRSAKNELEFLKRVLREAKERGQRIDEGILAIPSVRHRPRRGRALTVPELQELSSWFPAHVSRLILLAGQIGCRQNVWFNLTDEMVDLRSGTLTIPAALAKRGREHRIYLTGLEGQLIHEQLMIRAKGTPLVFPTVEGRKWTANRFRDRAWVRAVEAAVENDPARKRSGSVFEGFTFHMLRHTAASLMALAGMDPAAAAERLEHSDGGALFHRTYRHLYEGEKRAQAQRLEALVLPYLDESGTTNASGSQDRPPEADSEDGRYWARTSDPQLVELVLSQLS
jgi:integrase